MLGLPDASHADQMQSGVAFPHEPFKARDLAQGGFPGAIAADSPPLSVKKKLTPGGGDLGGQTEPGISQCPSASVGQGFSCVGDAAIRTPGHPDNRALVVTPFFPIFT